MKQTAVEWLESRIKVLIPDDIGSQLMFKSNIKKAKAKELEQIKNTYLTCWEDYTGCDGKHWEMGRDPNETFNEYYNEIYASDEIKKSEIPINLTPSQTEISDETGIKLVKEINKQPMTFVPNEISDEEIISKALEVGFTNTLFIDGAKWYREQLKKKQ